MLILYVTDAWTPQINGVVNTSQNTIRCLEELGHNVMVVHPGEYLGFPIPGLHGLKFALPPYGIGKMVDVSDAIHIATEGPLGIATMIYCNRRNIPYTTAFHTNFAVYCKDHFGIQEDTTFGFLRWVHSKSAAVMVPSASLMAELTQRGFQNVVLWGRGVDATIFNAEGPRAALEAYGPPPYFLSVGRVSREKNLEAFLSLKLPGTKLVVGAGPDFRRLSSAYPDAVFLGVRTGSTLASIYRAADVFVFPSKFDTYGLVNIEAISCGTPVAAYPVTGPIDIVTEGVTGILDDDLEQACLKALNLPRPNQSYSWEDATKIFLSHLRPVVK